MAPKSSKNRDWAQYNAAAKKSGEITFYISQEAINSWENEAKTGRRGASHKYSGIACLTDNFAVNTHFVMDGVKKYTHIDRV